MIIEHPSLVPLHSRLGWSCVTALFWGLWIYLWMPLATLAGWSFGFYQAHHYFQWEQQVIELKRLLALYSILIAAFGGTLLAWALSEYIRFRNKRRRAAAVPVQPRDLARHAGLATEDIAAWQTLRCAVAQHDEYGALSGAKRFGQMSRSELAPARS